MPPLPVWLLHSFCPLSHGVSPVLQEVCYLFKEVSYLEVSTQLSLILHIWSSCRCAFTIVHRKSGAAAGLCAHYCSPEEKGFWPFRTAVVAQSFLTFIVATRLHQEDRDEFGVVPFFKSVTMVRKCMYKESNYSTSGQLNQRGSEAEKGSGETGVTEERINFLGMISELMSLNSPRKAKHPGVHLDIALEPGRLKPGSNKVNAGLGYILRL